MLCDFNPAPREDGYSPSEIFHSRRVRSYLPSLDDTVDVDKCKEARKQKDMVVKNTTKTHKPLKPLKLGDLCYKRDFDGKKTLRIESLCEVIEVHTNGESYYIWDLTTVKIYLRNGSWIKPSESSLNEIHQAKILKVKCEKLTCHRIKEGNVSSTKIEVPTVCLRSKNSEPPSKRVIFDQTMILARCELKCW